ncbi:MAG: hypothetical protein DMF74_09425 [Acidobacteria bacterium]|nr:MAG: hypothetical protein DMF74_09425 [Acidobacteriota bacterium]
MSTAHFTITALIVLLLIASAVAMATKWVPVPYTVALVIVGLAISPFSFRPAVHISPDLIWLIFLPPLLFEASWNLKLDSLRANLIPILSLAFVGVGLSFGIIGLILHYAAGLGWSSSLLFGALISATDPVSVLALFKKLGAPLRLTIIVEAESLFNDGAAAVVFRILLGIVIGAATFNSKVPLAVSSVAWFLLATIGGVLVGALIGFAASALTGRFDDHLLEVTLTTISAYGTFIVADALYVSPVIAVVVVGIVIGNYGRRRKMSPNTQVAVDSFWEYAAFVANSLVFLLIGLEIPLALLLQHWLLILWAILAMTVARAMSVYGLFPIIHRFTERVAGRWQHIIFWGGLRGSLSIALALSLPATVPGRVELVAMTFGAVTFSLLLQGLTISPLMNRLRIERR